jgi:hypothetical protein
VSQVSGDVNRVLVAGVPRSGTTWVGRVLERTEGAVYVHEPDGDHDPFAFRARLGHGVAPALDADADDQDLERLFAAAFAGGRYAGTFRDKAARRLYAQSPLEDRWRAWLGGPVTPRLRLVSTLAIPRVAAPDAQHVVVKSVRSELAMDWLVARFHPRVLLVERHPLNVLASWIELDYVRDVAEAAAFAGYAQQHWGVDPPRPSEPRLVHQVFEYAVLACALRDAARRHDDWLVVGHEQLCVDPQVEFRRLAEGLGLTWTDAAAAGLAEADRAGTGYRTNRRAADQPERWKERLDADQVTTIRATLERFPEPLVPRA